MNREENSSIRDRLNGTFRCVFNDDSIAISDEMTAANIPDWDSLAHITLVVAIEKEFGIKLRAAEIGKLKNVGEMIAIIERQTAG